MAVKVEMRVPEVPPPPAAEFIIRHTEGQGSWKLTETEARQLHRSLGDQLADLDATRLAAR